MDAVLNPVEVRVLGSLIEKQITTPEYYPLSLNALTAACNQKSNREPVVSYEEATVERGMDGLRDKKLAWVIKKADSRVLRYGHLLPEALHLEPDETAVLCALMLRGPLTVGEIRGCTGRLYDFQELSQVDDALGKLASNDQGPLVVKLPRQAGHKEARYAHLLSGEEKMPEPEPLPVKPDRPIAGSAGLESEVKALRQDLDELRRAFEKFKKQFD
ncbi:MAG TPA: YceH family protein [Blastocatellia bacterium]